MCACHSRSSIANRVSPDKYRPSGESIPQKAASVQTLPVQRFFLKSWNGRGWLLGQLPVVHVLSAAGLATCATGAALGQLPLGQVLAEEPFAIRVLLLRTVITKKLNIHLSLIESIHRWYGCWTAPSLQTPRLMARLRVWRAPNVTLSTRRWSAVGV